MEIEATKQEEMNKVIMKSKVVYKFAMYTCM